MFTAITFKYKIDYNNIVKVSKMDKIYIPFNTKRKIGDVILLTYNYNNKIEQHYNYEFHPEEFYTLFAVVCSGDLLVRNKDEKGHLTYYKDEQSRIKNIMSEFVEYSGYTTIEEWRKPTGFYLPKFMYKCNVIINKSIYTTGNHVHNEMKLNLIDGHKILCEFNCYEYYIVRQCAKRIREYFSASD